MKNVEILQKANAAVAKGDYESFLSFCTEDTKWFFVGEQTLYGKDAVRQYIRQTYLETPRFTVEKMIEGEDHVTAIGEITLKDKDGNESHYHYCDVWRFENSKMAELNAFVVPINK